MAKNERKTSDYIHLQPEVTKRSRMMLIDWLIEVQDDLKLTDKTLYLAINIIDRFLAAETITIDEFQCVGIIALFIASKYQETNCRGFRPDVNEFVDYCDGAYERQDGLAMEIRILNRLGWRLSTSEINGP
ncbi:Cyclin A/B/D/E [Artemisia annua]|uniref:Cyclin A/B/D/E n=1 Tax=Artemisia annua TaxID=35608 RepID=A0A2U1NCQ5_ARTAN|nr:Cyclin A/B/D/E [Artemisia annua]